MPKERTEMETADELRRRFKRWTGEEHVQRERFPNVGDIVEVDGVLSICTEYYKGYCNLLAIDDRGELSSEGHYSDSKSLSFIVDEERRGPRKETFKIRDDLM